MAAAQSFKDLLVYQRASAFADDVRRAVLAWSSFDRWTLGVQLARSADSIGANIAEAFGRLHDADQRRLLLVARGSSYETEHWIDRAAARGLMTDPSYGARASEIGRMLNGLIRTHSNLS